MPFTKGMIFTEEHKAKLSLAQKGKPRPWMIGFKHSEETKLKIGLSSRGNTYRRGVLLPQELKNRISETLKGQVPWNKGLTGEGWPEARRRVQEARKGKPNKSRTGKARKLYQSSSGKEYHPNWHVIRKEIYKRDNWTCRECGVKCNSQGRKKIQCHHIDYDESNNEVSNLVTLCASCHGRTKGSRKDWIRHFKGV